ncbi:DUF6083 domain-containing protein [Streptomyces sp. NBC_00273]|uniref:DUF6083 domain-containing protein n=1 Tax=Streptomyces sp. NBC_00273 TaxID=2903644 RepID=UPI002E2E0890|nr:DUF6083 domain-containing protein [Streptomyces sp. NBC_00273]
MSAGIFAAMRSTNTHLGHLRDGSSPRHRHRALRIATDSPSCLLRTAEGGLCPDCGNQVHWYRGIEHQPVRLHPHELPTAAVPEVHRWHIGAGVAYPAGDGSPWCRIAHRTLCPAHDTPEHLTQPLVRLRQRLALQTRRLLDDGAFTPPGQHAPAGSRPMPPCRPARPVVDVLGSRYLAKQPIQEIRCVARTHRGTRCLNRVLASRKPHGTWRLTTLLPGRPPVLPAVEIAVYDLGHLAHAEQQRWRAQRCPTHALIPKAADMARDDWEIFDPLLHRQHVATRLPVGAQGRPRGRA